MSKTAVANGLRALNPAEKRAVELHGRGTAMRGIIIQTGLSEQQITTAIGRHAEWEKLREQAAQDTARQAAWNKVPAPGEPDARSLWTLAEQAENEAPADVMVPDVLPVPAAVEPVAEPETADFDEILADAIVAADAQAPIVGHVIDRETGTEAEVPAEPETVDWDAVLADDDGTHPDELAPTPAPATGTDALLARAEASVQPRVRQLAAAVRIQLTELAQLLDSDEKVRALTIAAEVLRRQLAQTEAELAELMGTGPAPATPAAPATALAPASRAASTSAIRAWAIANGWEVPVRGILRGAVVAAYNAAHEGAS